MTAALKVVSAGLATTVQDAGRFGFQRQGVPVSGALDRVALAAANVVVGNPVGAAALEMLYQGAVVEVMADSVRVAVAGGGATLTVTAPDAETRRLAALESLTLGRGTRVAVSLGGPGIVAYLAVAGGIATPVVLGSRSTYPRAGLGGLRGKALEKGDVVPLGATAAPRGPERRLPLPPLVPPSTVRVVLGPQADYFSDAVIANFLATPWRIRPASDRMGLRLEGPPVRAARGHDIASDGIAGGAIQVPGDGQPIVLLADRQTTGGYPKIATVASADLPAVGRLAPGMTLRFQAVDVAIAEEARRRLEHEIARWPEKLVNIAAGDFDASLLLAANLIDGVVDAHGSSDES